MSVFGDDPAEWQRLDWGLLINSPVALYFSSDVLREDTEWFQTHAYVITALNCGLWQGADDLHEALSVALEFPAYYGRNFDALDECLSEISVPREGGRLLVLHSFSDFAVREPRLAQSLLESVARASRELLLTGRRFLALAHSLDPRIEFSPVGACPVMWNPREFLNSSRGLSAAT